MTLYWPKPMSRTAPARPVAWMRAVGGLLVLAAIACGGSAPARAASEPVPAEISVDTSRGYARLVLRFEDEVDATVRMANNVLVVTFKTPVRVGVDRLATNAAGYIAAARRDPDGKGLRMALSRKVTMNSMMAGERLFIDLLPDSWTGEPPGLPQEVVEELARRARNAEIRQRQQRALARERQPSLVRVRVAHQPTFSRYVFELPELIPVATERARDSLKLLFDAPVKFDLADVKASLPPTVESIESVPGSETTPVTFTFIGKVDVRSFREDNNYVVDIAPIDAKPRTSVLPQVAVAAAAAEPPRPKLAAPAPAKSAALGDLEAPQTVSPPPSAASPPARPPSSLTAAPRQANAQPATPASAADPPPAAPAAPEAASKPAAGAVGGAAPQSVAAPPPVAVKPEAAPAAAPPPAPQSAPRLDVNAPVVAEMRRHAENLKLTFPFAAPTPAAVFRRADTLWLVFDSAAPINVEAFNNDQSRTVRGATVTRSNNGQVVRVKLERPRLTSLTAEGTQWLITLGDLVLEPARPLAINRAVVGAQRASAVIPFDEPRTRHRLTDPEAGDAIDVITALGPARGFLKTQEFIEFNALATTHGVAIQPIADDLTIELGTDSIVLGRPNGLTLSSASLASRRAGSYRPQAFDGQLWGFDREANYVERQAKLITAAASAPETKRTGPRLELARFYLAREMYAEAKAVLDLALNDERQSSEDATALVLRAVASIMMGRIDEALKELANPLVGNQHDAQLWRAVAFAKQGKWGEAREAFRTAEAQIGMLPVEMQRLVLRDAVRASIETRDFGAAATQLSEFDMLGLPKDLEPSIAVLNGRLAESLGRTEDALAAYRAAAGSAIRPSAAQGKLREIVLRYQLGDLKRSDVISELEQLTTIWRGDETEIEALQLLARLYTEENRYRDAFYVMRTALKAHPNSEMTRRIQEEAASTFDALFLAGKGDAMPAIDALALFYDFRELTPIGRRGDEMIRRLSDRLVSVDLLDQAAELLQHQVDHRLQGAARAQVATRLAVIYLMNRKPDRALAVLRSTRISETSNELRNQRLLLEGRALAEVGRQDLALEVIANIEGPEAVRLRSDILWSAKRWREAAEQIELLYNTRGGDFLPLTDPERADILRAGVGYAMADDALGTQRFREKFAAKMGDSPERRAFEVATAPAGADGADFLAVARAVAAVDTLESFLRELRARYPETGSFTSPAMAQPPKRPAAEPAPQTRRPAADPTPTGSVKAAPAAAKPRIFVDRINR